jgi:hypothetical protein
MPRVGPIYTLPVGYFATPGTTILTTQHNPPLEDIAQALTNSLASDGSTPLTGNLQMNANKITGLAAGTNPGDAVRFDQVPNLTGLTATVTELNHVDGVTSNIQTQLDAKQATITVLPLANGGTGSALVDPGADRIMFWDDSAGEVAWLTAGTGLTITGTTIDAATAYTWLSEVSTNSGAGPTSIASGIPATATEIVIRFKDVSIVDVNANIAIRLGTSGGIVSTGYLGGASLASVDLSFATGFGIYLSSDARKGIGKATLTKIGSTNLWSYVKTGFNTGTGGQMQGAGEITLGDVLTQISVAVTGTGNFDDGDWTVGWR